MWTNLCHFILYCSPNVLQLSSIAFIITYYNIIVYPASYSIYALWYARLFLVICILLAFPIPLSIVLLMWDCHSQFYTNNSAFILIRFVILFSFIMSGNIGIFLGNFFEIVSMQLIQFSKIHEFYWYPNIVFYSFIFCVIMV